MYPLLLLLSQLLFVSFVHSFASFFVDRPSACFLNLREPQEVIMNAYLVQPHASPFTNTSLYLQVTPQHPETHFLQKDSVFILDSSQGQEEWDFLITLIYPATQLKDLQYVLDVATVLQDKSTLVSPDTASLQASFTQARNSGCHNTRVYSRGKDHETFTLHIHKRTQQYHQNNQEMIHLIGAWATGHEPVKLTYPLSFILQSKLEDVVVSKQEHQQQEQQVIDVPIHIQPVRQQRTEDFSWVQSFQNKYSHHSIHSFSLQGYGIGMMILILGGIITWYMVFLQQVSLKKDGKRREDEHGDELFTWKER